MARDFAIWVFHLCVLSLLPLSHQPLQVSGRRAQPCPSSEGLGFRAGAAGRVDIPAAGGTGYLHPGGGWAGSGSHTPTPQKSNSEPFFSFDNLI